MIYKGFFVGGKLLYGIIFRKFLGRIVRLTPSPDPLGCTYRFKFIRENCTYRYRFFVCKKVKVWFGGVWIRPSPAPLFVLWWLRSGAGAAAFLCPALSWWSYACSRSSLFVLGLRWCLLCGRWCGRWSLAWLRRVCVPRLLRWCRCVVGLSLICSFLCEVSYVFLCCCCLFFWS